MLKRYLRHHRVVATHSRAEIRDPLLKVVLALLLASSGLSIVYRILDVVWINIPVTSKPFDMHGLLLLSPLLCGAIYMIYMAYLLLFASARRARKGFLRPVSLKISGLMIICLGIGILVKANIYGIFVIAVGGACFGLARDRKDFIASDNEWV